MHDFDSRTVRSKKETESIVVRAINGAHQQKAMVECRKAVWKVICELKESSEEDLLEIFEFHRDSLADYRNHLLLVPREVCVSQNQELIDCYRSLNYRLEAHEKLLESTHK